ncbi:MAG: FKBP-type peptidyl-prolyl cis-trans isomerase, partial [Myxococcales bacterium]|nr:FKBP-type peptidyl-prolyl cis-trans isomerase [Myxococcales bacterium]
GEVIVEGILPETEGKKLDIKTPEIEFEAPFDGKALNSNTLASGVETHDYAMGEGEEVVEGKQVEFNFTGYASANARPVMGSRLKPAKLIINEATRTRDPIANAMADGMLGMKVGGKRKVKVPAAVVEEGAPPGRPAIGDIWMTVEVIGVEDPFIPQPAEAYAAAPVRTEKLDSGVQIYDIVAGEGPTAEDGYQVVAHYIGQLENGTEFDSSHSRAEGLSVTIGAGGVIQGFAEGLKGVRKGMLRKVVIPPEMGYGDRAQGDKIPANSTLVFLLEITEVTEGKPLPMAPGGMPGGAPTPAGKPEKGEKGDKPEKPAKPPKPAKPDEGNE